MKFSTQAIADMLGAKLVGDPERQLSTLAKIEDAPPHALSFIANPKYTHFVKNSQAGAILVSLDFDTSLNTAQTYLLVPDAYSAFALLLQKFSDKYPKQTGIASTAVLDASCKLGNDVYIGALSVLEADCTIGDNVQIYPQVYLGKNVKIGKNTTIFAGVKIYKDTQIGENCIVQSGVVIGSDGFGFAPQPDGSYKKIPQNGCVIIENDVEIGANTTIDCATLGATILRKGVKIDNLVQIAHNVEIGENTVIAAQVAVAGSAKIGKNCMVGGQAAFAGHITVADGSHIGGKTGVYKSITQANQKWFGVLAKPHFLAMKEEVLMRNLPKMHDKLNELMKNSENQR